MQKIKILLLLFSLILIFSCSGDSKRKSDEVFDADKVFALANEFMDKKDYEEARSALFEIKNRDLTKKYAPLAQLRIADSYIREDEPDKAIEEYKRFLEIYPEHKYASYAQYNIGMTYFNQIESSERGYGAASKALLEFEKLKRDYPRNPYRDALDQRMEKCKEIMADYEFVVGEFYYKKDSYEAAIKRFENMLQRFPGFKKEPSAIFYLGISYKKRGEKNKASEYLNLLIEKYPKSEHISAAKKELSLIK